MDNKKSKVTIIILSVFLLISLVISVLNFTKIIYLKEENHLLNSKVSDLENEISSLDKRLDDVPSDVSDRVDDCESRIDNIEDFLNHY